MNKTPLPVIVIAWLYIAVGAVALAYDLRAFLPRHSFAHDIAWISLVHLLAIISGIYMLRGSDWARWLAIAWMAFHVVVGGLDSWFALVVHSLLLAALVYFLFRPQAARYFRGARTERA
jgi:hypothetical protein